MNKIITAALIITVGCFSACAEKDAEQDSSLVVKDSINVAGPAAVDTQNVFKADTGNISTAGQTLVNPLPQQVVSQVTGNTASGMNPAHGQPNHRCDIAVGAPLNSAPSKPAAQTATPVTASPAIAQPVTATPAQSTAKTVTAPGMNPPHGEPNHRCDISVGAPLSSPVTKPATPAVTPSITPSVAPSIIPVKKDSGN